MNTSTITREDIIAALELKGYTCKANDVVKNSVTLPGINIITAGENISPCIYIDTLLKQYSSIDDIVEAIISIYENHKSFDFDINQILYDKEWILEHLYIALQQSSNEELIKKQCIDCFEGLEQYLYIRSEIGDDGWSIKLNDSIMSTSGITYDEAWESARHNTFSKDEPVIKSLSSLLFDITGCPDFQDLPGVPPIFVLTNKKQTKGSIQIFNEECINNFVSTLEREKGIKPCKLVILPSSIQEVLLYPIYPDDVFDATSEEELSALVQAVNSESVDPIDVLSDHVFILNL